MADYSIGDKMNFISGEVQALLTFAVVIAKNCRAAPEVFSEFQQKEQERIAEVEMLLVGDEFLKGFQFASEKIRTALEG
jgi:hypothetical protein